MNKRPTPETDASRGYALSSHYGRLEGSYLQMDRKGPFVHAEVARKLERERDEARAVAGEMADIASKHLSFLLAVTPVKANETHEKETMRVIDALKRWKKL
jgi:hypothetical protein